MGHVYVDQVLFISVLKFKHRPTWHTPFDILLAYLTLIDTRSVMMTSTTQRHIPTPWQIGKLPYHASPTLFTLASIVLVCTVHPFFSRFPRHGLPPCAHTYNIIHHGSISTINTLVLHNRQPPHCSSPK